MKIYSLVLEKEILVPAEVEIFLIPGLPTIHVLGLPDQVIKESLLRIKSAIRAQGFQWPKARQIVVNIRPVNIKKSSRGLELAIAAGILWVTKQISSPILGENYFVYGELGLNGDVLEPDDLQKHYMGPAETIFLTGVSSWSSHYHRDRVQNLKQLAQPERISKEKNFYKSVRPIEGLVKYFSDDEAKLLSVIALGGFHSLLAGPAGIGKSTLVHSLISFLAPPTENDFRLSRIQNLWRPWIAPHHSTTALSLIGANAPPKRGEISRADGGILFLDELLEFAPKAQEALREPLETGKLRLGRGAYVAEFPAEIQLIATTNLCPCGSWVPGEEVGCERSFKNCRSYVQKISGPFFDRFHIFAILTQRPQQRLIKGEDVLSRMTAAQKILENMPEEEAALTAESFKTWNYEIIFKSERRKQSTLRVARVLAAVKGRNKVDIEVLNEALGWTLYTFERLLAPSRLTQ